MQSQEYRKTIESDLRAGHSSQAGARKIYLCYPTFSFVGRPDREFLIKDKIAQEFNIDIFSVHFGGSGKTGESYHKINQFKLGESDLDAGVISSRLFNEHLEEALDVTNGFYDLTSYGDRADDLKEFKARLVRGILIPEKMPECPGRNRWIEFFENLSFGNQDLFKDISCWVYLSQKTYEMKFSKTIDLLRG